MASYLETNFAHLRHCTATQSVSEHNALRCGYFSLRREQGMFWYWLWLARLCSATLRMLRGPIPVQ
jgi:hypothetical protein